MLVSDLVGESKYKFPRTQGYLFVFFAQFASPLVAALLAFKIDVQPAKVVEESKIVSCFFAYFDQNLTCSCIPRSTSEP
jgi:hypothetical protein